MKPSVLFAFFISLTNATYFVQLKNPSTFNDLIKYDERIKTSNHLKAKVGKLVSFGKFEGFFGNFTKDVMDRLSKNPLVLDIIPDFPIMINSDYDTQFMSPRHLSRLSRHDKLPNNSSVNYYFNGTGKDIYAYIIDTGIYKEHPELEGRVIFGEDFTGEGPGDFNGHGTHVAGIIGSKTFGVAKQVTMVEVKALDQLGQGSLQTVISALEFVVNDIRDKNVTAVVNLSLGAIKNNVLNQAIQAAFEGGLLVVVAAGNANMDSCLTSPASSEYAISVGSIDDRTDTIASFSNWGECVDIFTSGVSVQSLSHKYIDSPLALSGTSMSAPSITGLTAILLEKGIPMEEVGDKLKEMSTQGGISHKSLTNKPLTANRIAFNGVAKQDDEYDDAEFGEVEFIEPVPLRELNPQRVGGLKF